MNLTNSLANAFKYTDKNRASLYSGVAIIGTIGTAYLAAKATAKAIEVINNHKETNEEPEETLDKIKEYAPLVWRFYIPAAFSAAATITAIGWSNSVNGRKTAAAVSAYTLTEKAFSEYKEKVVEEIGVKKEQNIRDQIVEEKLKDFSDSLILPGSGDVLCCEMYTRRYFMSDMETLRKAQNDINMEILDQYYVTLDYFYSLINLSTTSHSGELGWDSDRLLELEFSTTLTENGKPCLTFCYNYLKPI